MKLESDKYLVTTDGDQFILQMKKFVEDSPLLKDKSTIGTLRGVAREALLLKFIRLVLWNGYSITCYLIVTEVQSFEQILDLITETKSALDESLTSK